LIEIDRQISEIYENIGTNLRNIRVFHSVNGTFVDGMKNPYVRKTMVSKGKIHENVIISEPNFQCMLFS
jgi:hypothetical protein